MKIDNLKAKNIVDKSYFSVSPEDSLKKALGKIREEDVFAVPVMKDGKLEGMITWRKIIQRSAPPKTKVKNLLSHPPKIDSETGLVDLAETMLETGSRAVPVYENDDFIGIITQREIIRAVSKDETFREKKIKDVSMDPVTIRDNETIGKAKATMRENRIARLPVVDEEGKLAGSIDLSGIVKTFHPEKAMKVGEKRGDAVPERDSPVTSIMNRNPLVISRDADMKEVARKITESGGLYVITVDEDRPKGIVTPKDIIEMIAARKEEEGAYIQIAGAKDFDSFAKDKIMDAAERKVEKAGRMFRNVERLVMHLKTQNTEGNKKQYATRARIFTSDGLFVAKEDWKWDLLESVHGCLEKLDKQMTKHHEKKVERNREKKRGSQ